SAGRLDQTTVQVRDFSGKLSVNAGFTAISTNPNTQEVWATTGNLYGKVSELEFQTMGDTGVRTGISAAAWNSSGTMLALGLRDGSIRLYAQQRGDAALTEVMTIPGHASSITTLSWHGDVLASGSVDGVARLWNLQLTTQDREMLKRLDQLAKSDRSANQSVRNAKADYDSVAPWLNARLMTLLSHP